MLSSISGDFVRISNADGETDTLKGSFLFFDDRIMFVSISHPLHQEVFLDGETTLIFYPDRMRGFRLISEHPAIPPIVPGLFSAMRPDAGISDLGYELGSYESKGDSVISHWNHPKLGTRGGEAALVHLDDKLIRFCVTLERKGHSTCTNFSDFFDVNDVSIPGTIHYVATTQGETVEEWTHLDHLQVDPEIPEHVRDYDFPPGTDVTEKSW